MEKKDLIKVENAAIRAAGSRMAKMFHPIIPMGGCTEAQGYKEAERAFYEGFQEGAAFYRLLVSRIDDEFANLIEGARLDSGPGEDTHSVMGMCPKNGIHVITAAQKAPGKKKTEKLRDDFKDVFTIVSIEPEVAKKFADEHTTKNEQEEPNKDDSSVAETMEARIKDTPEQCQPCDSNVDGTTSCANIEKIREQYKLFTKKIEFPIEGAKDELEKEEEEPKGDEEEQTDLEVSWQRPIYKIEKVLGNLGVKFELEGDGNIVYLRFTRGFKAYTIYFENQDDGNYKVVFSDRDAHGGKVLWDGVITDSMTLMALERSITEHIKGW